MTWLLWSGAIAAVLAVEVGVATALAGRRPRRDVALAALFGNLAFESVFAIADASGGAWPVIGLVALLAGEIASIAGLGRVRLLHATAIVLIANTLGAVVMTTWWTWGR